MSTRLQAADRREQLIETAIDLFSQKGFKGTTTREIAAQAGVTEAVIFRHFATKEQLYKAIIDRKVNSPLFEKWIAELREAMDRGDDEAVIRRLLTAIIRTHQLDPRFERVMLYAALERNEVALLYMCQVTESVATEFCEYFKRRQTEGGFVEMPPEAALLSVVGMAFHYAQITYIHGLKEAHFTDDIALESFTKIALNGLLKRTPSKASRKK